MATIKDGKGTVALCAFSTDANLQKHEIGRPSPSAHDVDINIKYCGMCHSDLHAVNGDWGMDNFPMAPGHEIAGIVQSVGSDVTEYKVGDRVAVGCFVESCGSCDLCHRGQECYCPNHTQTYGTPFPSGKGHDDCAGHYTNGGYSSQIVVNKKFVYAVPESISLEHVGPLLCAGITMFSPLNKHVLKKKSNGNKGDMKVGIVGFGGLGHTGVKLAKAMGADVTVISRSTAKKEAAAKLGAGILAHQDEEAMKEAEHTFDLIIDTVSVQHDIDGILKTLKKQGTYVFIGGIPQPVSISPFMLLINNWSIEGSLVGGVPETKEMLEFCAKHDVRPDIKVISAKDANEQFQALHAGTAPAARAVIDMSTLADL